MHQNISPTSRIREAMKSLFANRLLAIGLRFGSSVFRPGVAVEVGAGAVLTS